MAYGVPCIPFWRDTLPFANCLSACVTGGSNVTPQLQSTAREMDLSHKAKVFSPVIVYQTSPRDLTPSKISSSTENGETEIASPHVSANFDNTSICQGSNQSPENFKQMYSECGDGIIQPFHQYTTIPSNIISPQLVKRDFTDNFSPWTNFCSRIHHSRRNHFHDKNSNKSVNNHVTKEQPIRNKFHRSAFHRPSSKAEFSTSHHSNITNRDLLQKWHTVHVSPNEISLPSRPTNNWLPDYYPAGLTNRRDGLSSFSAHQTLDNANNFSSVALFDKQNTLPNENFHGKKISSSDSKGRTSSLADSNRRGSITGSRHVGNIQGIRKKKEIPIDSANRPYKCQCGRAFVRNEELTRHSRIHSGYKPHRCHICNKTFGRKDHLNKHVKTHLDSSQKKVHLCNLPNCGQTYTRSDALARHQMNSHGIKAKPTKWRPKRHDL